MVRVFTFAGLLVGTYVGVKALDSVIVWMAERRQANLENEKLDRDAVQLKQKLLRQIKEKQAIEKQRYERRTGYGKDAMYSKFSGLFRRSRQQKQGSDLDDFPDFVRVNFQQFSERRRSQMLKAEQEEETKSSGAQKTASTEAEAPVDERDEDDSECHGEVKGECLKCGETFDFSNTPHTPRKSDDYE